MFQTDSNYLKLKDDMVYAEAAVQEVEAKLANLNEDLNRIVDQLQQVFYMKSQLKSQSNPVEYLMPQTVTDQFARANRAVR